MKKFDRSLNGYNISQVNQFIDDVIINVDDMINKMKQKDMEIDRLTKELEHYKSMEATLNRAVVIAEEASNKYQSASLKESDLIVNDAKKNANRIINDALLRAEKLEQESARLRRNIVSYKRRIHDLMDQQIELIDDLDKIDFE